MCYQFWYLLHGSRLQKTSIHFFFVPESPPFVHPYPIALPSDLLHANPQLHPPLPSIWEQSQFCLTPDGILEWHRRHLHLVQTFVPEQNLQIHSFRPSIVTASAKTFSARTCPVSQVFFFRPSPLQRLPACVWHPSVPDITRENAAEDKQTHTTQGEYKHKNKDTNKPTQTDPILTCRKWDFEQGMAWAKMAGVILAFSSSVVCASVQNTLKLKRSSIHSPYRTPD